MNIVFLDIDGVLQPEESMNRFYSDRSIIDKLSKKYNIDYSEYNYWDVVAVYYDWDEQAVSRLKYILDKTGSKIIISSDWRKKEFPNKMRDLLTIQGLNKYYFCDNIIWEGDKLTSVHDIRRNEINDSLNRYDISNFVILDDMVELMTYFPNNTVITKNIISISNMNDAIRILKR